MIVYIHKYRYKLGIALAKKERIKSFTKEDTIVEVQNQAFLQAVLPYRVDLHINKS